MLRTCSDSAGCAICRTAAARENEPCSTMAMKYRSCRISIVKGLYQQDQLRIRIVHSVRLGPRKDPAKDWLNKNGLAVADQELVAPDPLEFFALPFDRRRPVGIDI